MKAFIERAKDGGFGVYCNEIETFGYGLTEQEAKEDFIENVKDLAEYEKEINGATPQWKDEDVAFAVAEQ